MNNCLPPTGRVTLTHPGYSQDVESGLGVAVRPDRWESRAEKSRRRKIKLAGGNEASVERFCQAQPNAVGEYPGMDGFVEGILAEELGKSGAGAKRGRSDSEIKSCENTAMRIQGLVPTCRESECPRTWRGRYYDPGAALAREPASARAKSC